MAHLLQAHLSFLPHRDAAAARRLRDRLADVIAWRTAPPLPPASWGWELARGPAIHRLRQRIRQELIGPASVCAVLIGPDSAHSAELDWVLSACLGPGPGHSARGIVGVLSPDLERPGPGEYDPDVLPGRLWDAVVCGRAWLVEAESGIHAQVAAFQAAHYSRVLPAEAHEQCFGIPA